MHRSIRCSSALVVAGVIAAGAAIAPAAAQAKTYKVNLSFVGGLTGGVNMAAKVSGKPLGTCSMKGKLVIPDTQQVWTCKGGTIKVTGHGTSGAADDAKGTWKITGGTGKFKKVTGGGAFTGKQSTGKFSYTGSISY